MKKKEKSIKIKQRNNKNIQTDYFDFLLKVTTKIK